MRDKKINIAIFASGAGSNAEKIINYFAEHNFIKVSVEVTNKSDAGVITIAKSKNISVEIISKKQLEEKNEMEKLITRYNIDWIILAGFLLKIPEYLIQLFPHKIINIHPALLPKYGGKGMYGAKVHQAVIENKETQSGITIHFVDEHYDHGKIISQATCDVAPNDTVETLATKIHQLEHLFYARIIEQVVLKMKNDLVI